MSLSDQFTTLKAAISVAEAELAALNGGKKSAAPRFRKSLQNIKLQSQLIRKATTEHTKALPVKSRIKKPVTILELLVEPTPEPEPVEQVEPKPKKTKTNKNKKVLFV